ncbi:unnamed protein product, partial [Vitis vinifera]
MNILSIFFKIWAGPTPAHYHITDPKPTFTSSKFKVRLPQGGSLIHSQKHSSISRNALIEGVLTASIACSNSLLKCDLHELEA